jgi:DNA-directed RNA polymerase
LKDKFDKNKQIRALMPNLIHSLDSISLSLLFESFSKSYNDSVQFFSIHDCFGTTCEKVFVLKTILASVYIDLYSTDPYLIKLDNNVFDQIERESDYKVDRVNRTVEINDVIHEILDIN